MSPAPGESRDSDRLNSNSEEDIESTIHGDQLVINTDFADSDNDDIDEPGENQGYVLLSQDSEDENAKEDGAETIHNQAIAEADSPPAGMTYFPDTVMPSYMQVPDLPRPARKDILWNQPRQDLPSGMDDEQVAAVKAAMAGFKLPDSSVPFWAKSITDETWKQQLLSRLQPDGSSFTSSEKRISPNVLEDGEDCVKRTESVSTLDGASSCTSEMNSIVEQDGV